MRDVSEKAEKSLRSPIRQTYGTDKNHPPDIPNAECDSPDQNVQREHGGQESAVPDERISAVNIAPIVRNKEQYESERDRQKNLLS